MSIEKIRTKLHNIVDEIEDETTLSLLMEDAQALAIQKLNVSDDNLNSEEWTSIEKAQQQIKSGNYKTYDEVKQHFSQWLTK
ncbi:MAG: hypothetical protein LH615_08895 [Ferruginibacter sp.]|nr:hypothetical protein [Ferruginibacter sp.]